YPAIAGTGPRAPAGRAPGTRPPGEPHPYAAGGGSTPDTARRIKVAGCFCWRDTFSMRVPTKRGPFFLAAAVLALAALAYSARADEIRLKDGKKLYGVIVAYEENMFKVKTDYGYVLVEKDKIASITPTTPPAKSEPAPTAKKETPPHPSKPAGEAQPKTEPAVASAANTKDGAMPANASLKTTVPASSLKSEKTPSKTAIVAMGTIDESTLMVVGEEKTKESLDAAAAAVEKRLHDVYVNYQRVSQKKTVVGGMPAVDYRYRGKADDRDWSGRLVVIARSK